MATASRDRSARARIREYLLQHGPVEDASGRATSLLKEAVGYQGNDVAFIQLVTAMDKGDELRREIRGKRTYRISAPAARGAAGAHRGVVAVADEAAPGLAIDYDELARALLRELARVLVTAEADALDSTAQETAERAVGELGAVIEERDQLRAERDDYAKRLKIARRQLSALLAQSMVGDDAESAPEAGDLGPIEQAS